MSEYEGHRYWLLHELRRCRAQGRLGLQVQRERMALQKELAKLRRIK